MRVFSIFKRILLWSVIVLSFLSLLLILPFRWFAPPTTAFMLQAQWEEDIKINYQWTPLTGISRQLAISVVAAEDQKFPNHMGFDFKSIMDALSDEGTRRRGASTISQQVAKNLYLWGGRSYLRKGVEAYATLLIELLWPKRRILEVYLNIAEFGPGVYGAGAASQIIFNKSASKLTAYESALLAAVLPNPKKMLAGRPSVYVQGRAEQILNTIDSLGGVYYLEKL